MGVYIQNLRMDQRDAIRGKRELELREDIRGYLPEGFLKTLRYEEPVTLLHLMNHTAGFEEQMLDLRFYREEEETSLMSVISDHQPEQIFKPGEVCAYSNWGAALAALIVEQVSGESWRDYITENILVPLNMNNTSAGPFWNDIPGLLENKATGYSSVRGSFKEEPPMHLCMYPAGAMNGSAADLLKYAQELAKAPGQETVLFQHLETKKKMFEETWRSCGANAGLSHGFWQYAGNDQIFGHEGGTYGFKTQFWVMPEEERAIMILTNVMETDFCSRIMEAISSNTSAPRNRLEEIADVSLYTGSYIPARSVWSHVGKIHGKMQSIIITKEGENKLKLTMPFEGKEFIYIPVEQDRFYCAQAAPEERILGFSREGKNIKTMSFRLAHDYVRATPVQSLAFTVLIAVLFLTASIFWMTVLVNRFRKSFNGKQGAVVSILLPAAMISMSTSCLFGFVHWFSHYTVISAELNVVAGTCWGCSLVGGVALVAEMIQKKKAQIPMCLGYLLQTISVFQLGFMSFA